MPTAIDHLTYTSPRSCHTITGEPSFQPTGQFPGGEPTGPAMQTACPGPESHKMRLALSETQETGAVKYFVDMEASRGNYVAGRCE